MSKQKERNLIIVLLVILIINVISLSTMLIILAARAEKVETQKQQEEVMETSATEVGTESTTSTMPLETEATNVIMTVETEPTNATMPTEEELALLAQSMDDFMPGIVFESNSVFYGMSREEVICYIKTEEGAVQELIAEICKDWIVQMTEEEFKTFCILVFAESGAECLEGQIAVAAVVINRMLDEYFPDTFYGVMNQANQFEVVENGRIVSSITNFEDLPDATIEAALRALLGEDPTEELLWEKALELGLDPVKYAEGGALFFYNPRYCSRHPKVVISIGNHNFHKVW